MQLVDQGGAQILPNSGYAATEADVAAARCSARLLQSGVNALGEKAKLRASRHPERRPRVMRQHENGRVIRRLVAPPALPAVVRPGPPDRTEHVATENPGADSGKALFRNSVVDSRLSVVEAVHPSPYARGEEPLHQLRAPDAEWILEILVRPSSVAVDGNREALDAEFRHSNDPQSTRESQPKLQQFIPSVAFDDAFDDAIDFRRTLQRRQERRAGELLCGAAHEGLSRIAPHARFAQYIGKRPARRDAALHAADGPDFLGEDPQHARRRLAFAAQAFEHARKPRALAREHRFGELERVVARHVHH